MDKIYKKVHIEKKKVDIENATLEAVFSTADVDRHGEIVMQNFDLQQYLLNPVVLNSHQGGDATETIGKVTNLSTDTGKLEGTIKFAVRENPKAKIIFDLYAGGFLKAFSIGFRPLEFGEDNVITQSELLEVSAVSVPANAFALAKSKGIEVDKLDKEVEQCECKTFETTEDGFLCTVCGNPYQKDEDTEEEPEEDDTPTEEETEPEEANESDESEEKYNKNPKLEAVKKIGEKARKEKERREQLLKEALAVIQQLTEERSVSKKTRKRMVNRAVQQLLKVK